MYYTKKGGIITDPFIEVWNEVLAICKTQISDVMFNMWLAPLEFVKFENYVAVFIINADYKRTVILDKFGDMIKNGFEQILGFPIDIDIIVSESAGEVKTASTEKKEKKATTEVADRFSPFTFDNYIVGKSNAFAYNVSLGVAENPGVKYNPLLIYGSSGVGKTHLMFAIVNKIKQKNPNALIIYTTGESFMTELIECITKKNMIYFHNKYRNADALLVDDIQYIQSGNTVQEEFFHTFNVLQQDGKQIVMTSDVPPREMEVLDERLRTRFEMGVLADIQPPDIDTRKAIIIKKSQQLGITLNEEIIEYIALKIKKNVRQLEGTVKKIEAMMAIYGSQLTMDQVKDIIKDIIMDSQPVSVMVDKILNAVSTTFEVSVADMKSDKRQANINQARQIAMYVIREITELTFKEIGSHFNKNYATVLHSVNQCKEKMDATPTLRATVNNIIKDFQENK